MEPQRVGAARMMRNERRVGIQRRMLAALGSRVRGPRERQARLRWQCDRLRIHQQAGMLHIPSGWCTWRVILRRASTGTPVEAPHLLSPHERGAAPRSWGLLLVAPLVLQVVISQDLCCCPIVGHPKAFPFLILEAVWPFWIV